MTQVSLPPRDNQSIARPAARGLAFQIGAATVARLIVNTAKRFPYVFAPALSRGLGVPLPAITSLIAVNQATGVLSPLFGPLADRWGYRLMMLAGLSILAVGMLAGGLLPVYGIILLALFLAGLGKSLFDPTLQSYIGERVPYQRRGLAIGVVEFSWAVTALAGIPVVGLLIAGTGWRSPFLLLGGLALLAVIALGYLIPGQDRQPGGAGSRPGFGEAWRRLRREPAALAGLGFSVFITAANDNLFVIYGVWLESSFGLSVTDVGLATMTIGVAELVGEGLTAFVADRVGLKRALFTGLVLSLMSYLLLPHLGHDLPLTLAGLFLIFLTFEFTIVTSISLFTEILPGARATMMSSNIAAMSIGRMTGALIGGSVWLVGGLTATSLVSAAMCALALACLAWGLRRWRA
ncbi:MAG: MFS transporter [Anaerolineae bacterium]